MSKQLKLIIVGVILIAIVGVCVYVPSISNSSKTATKETTKEKAKDTAKAEDTDERYIYVEEVGKKASNSFVVNMHADDAVKSKYKMIRVSSEDAKKYLGNADKTIVIGGTTYNKNSNIPIFVNTKSGDGITIEANVGAEYEYIDATSKKVVVEKVKTAGKVVLNDPKKLFFVKLDDDNMIILDKATLNDEVMTSFIYNTKDNVITSIKGNKTIKPTDNLTLSSKEKITGKLFSEKMADAKAQLIALKKSDSKTPEDKKPVPTPDKKVRVTPTAEDIAASKPVKPKPAKPKPAPDFTPGFEPEPEPTPEPAPVAKAAPVVASYTIEKDTYLKNTNAKLAIVLSNPENADVKSANISVTNSKGDVKTLVVNLSQGAGVAGGITYVGEFNVGEQFDVKNEVVINSVAFHNGIEDAEVSNTVGTKLSYILKQAAPTAQVSTYDLTDVSVSGKITVKDEDKALQDSKVTVQVVDPATKKVIKTEVVTVKDGNEIDLSDIDPKGTPLTPGTKYVITVLGNVDYITGLVNNVELASQEFTTPAVLPVATISQLELKPIATTELALENIVLTKEAKYPVVTGGEIILTDVNGVIAKKQALDAASIKLFNESGKLPNQKITDLISNTEYNVAIVFHANGEKLIAKSIPATKVSTNKVAPVISKITLDESDISILPAGSAEKLYIILDNKDQVEPTSLTVVVDGKNVSLPITKHLDKDGKVIENSYIAMLKVDTKISTKLFGEELQITELKYDENIQTGIQENIVKLTQKLKYTIGNVLADRSKTTFKESKFYEKGFTLATTYDNVPSFVVDRIVAIDSKGVEVERLAYAPSVEFTKLVENETYTINIIGVEDRFTFMKEGPVTREISIGSKEVKVVVPTPTPVISKLTLAPVSTTEINISDLTIAKEAHFPVINKGQIVLTDATGKTLATKDLVAADIKSLNDNGTLPTTKFDGLVAGTEYNFTLALDTARGPVTTTSTVANKVTTLKTAPTVKSMVMDVAKGTVGEINLYDNGGKAGVIIELVNPNKVAITGAELTIGGVKTPVTLTPVVGVENQYTVKFDAGKTASVKALDKEVILSGIKYTENGKPGEVEKSLVLTNKANYTVANVLPDVSKTVITESLITDNGFTIKADYDPAVKTVVPGSLKIQVKDNTGQVVRNDAYTKAIAFTGLKAGEEYEVLFYGEVENFPGNKVRVDFGTKNIRTLRGALVPLIIRSDGYKFVGRNLEIQSVQTNKDPNFPAATKLVAKFISPGQTATFEVTGAALDKFNKDGTIENIVFKDLIQGKFYMVLEVTTSRGVETINREYGHEYINAD